MLRNTSLQIAFLAALALVMASPSWAQKSVKQTDADRAGIRAALHIPNPLPALDVKHYGSFSPAPGVIADRVSYASKYGLRIPAIVYRPEKVRGKLPGLVVVDGHPADKTSWYSWYTGVMYAKAGAVVVTYDPVGEGERNNDHKDETLQHDTLIDVPGVPQRMGGTMITDVMQGVSYLRSLPQIDSKRIGVLGFSMGSFISALTGAVDPRIHALLLTGGGNLDGPGGYWDASKKVMCQSGPYHALEFLGDRPAAIYTLNARRGVTFIFNGTADNVVAIPTHGPDFLADLRERTIAMNGSATNIFETYFDEGAKHRPSWITKRAAIWLNDQLHFANWADFSKLPTITIGDWAAKSDFNMRESAHRDDQAGGLLTMDAGVPKLSRDQLYIMPREEWEKHRSEFVHASWAAAAIADAKNEKSAQVKQ